MKSTEIKTTTDIAVAKPQLELTEKDLDALLELSESQLEEFLGKLDGKEAVRVAMELKKWNSALIHKDCRKFRSQLLIDVDGKLVKLTDVMEGWQSSDFLSADSSWRSIIDGDSLPHPKFFWRERARGHSKTSDIATACLTAIYSAPRKITGLVAAASKDQARITRDAVDTLVRDNPWLYKLIDVQNYVVKNKSTGSYFEIISSDENTSYGKVVNFCVIDELTHWGGRELWDSIFSTADKKKNCILIVLTNAGMGMGSDWTWDVREAARISKDWHFSCLEGSVATWITPEVLERQRAFLSDKAFQRLWKNLWQRESGTGIPMDEVDRAMQCHEGPVKGYEPEKYACFMGSLDFSIHFDHSALVILALNAKRRKIRLAFVKSWKPQDFPNGKISPAVVQREAWDILRKYQCVGLSFDEWGFSGCAEWIESQYDPVTNYTCTTYAHTNTTTNLAVMATTLLRVLRNEELEMYPDKELRMDFSKASIKEMQGWSKLDAIRDEESGHADRLMALAIGLPYADETMKDILGID